MFKVVPAELVKLEEEGLLKRVNRREGSASKVKYTQC